jgi:hypothetical protein
MVADEEKYRDITHGKPADAPGELPLLGLAGLAGPIGVPAEDDKVNAVFYSVVNELIEDREKVIQA